MLKYINKLPNPFVDNLNTGIMNRVYDRSLVEYIVDSFRGLEILENIKIIGYEWDSNEDNYNVNDHIIRRNTNKNKAIKNITDSRCGILYIDAQVSGFDKNGVYKVHCIRKPIILPVEDNRGYFKIRGKKAYIVYQLVDKMSYPSISAVTLKSLMPVCIKTNKKDITSTGGETFTVPVYTIKVFKNFINVLMIYSHLAAQKMLNFLEVNRFIRFVKAGEYTPQDDEYYFEGGKKSDVVIAVKKEPFDEFVYVKSITGGLVALMDETKIPFDKLNDHDEWMIIAGGRNTIRRGVYQHILFNRMLDDVTQKELKVNDYDKQNIYYLLRWMIQNYHALWAKDNLSMINKRLRRNEYLGSLISTEISKKILHLVSLGDKATIKDYLGVFKFPENIFIVRLFSSGILRYCETNNDIDMAAKFAITKKGPQTLGATDRKRIPVRQRLLHPSMLGYIDIASTSSSDPGQGGDLSPWNQLKSFYFDESLAENEIHFKIKQYLDNHPLADTYEEFIIKCDTEEEYNAMLDKLAHYANDKIKMSAVITDKTEIIIEKDPAEGYRKFDESNLITERIVIDYNGNSK